ncbi:hypothetical protein DC345_22310 [Paenibacillus taichungensis]|uniref:Uncharacterized protein n=1 Tax=Paenibacillus taichungensis TaxID=484184 RepID=A0A329QKX6_9BACL|nr:hypothetical protein [Paenibacillus taichungensis]RAW12062.1 hypothetical protein DC345_22310 [Paenibacillus taichungensis]
MNVKLPKSIVRLSSIPLALLAWTLIFGLGSSHVYADNAQTSSANKSSGLSLNLFSQDSDGGLNLTPSVSVSTPLLDVEVPSIKANESPGKLSVSELKVDTPLGSAGTSEIGIDAKQGSVGLPSVKADTPIFKADVSSSEVNLNEGTAFLPGVTAEVPEVIKAETSAVNTNLRQGKVELPSVKVDVPEVTSINVSSSSVDLTEGEVQLPSVEANVPVVNLKPEQPVIKPDQPVFVKTPQVEKPAIGKTDSVDQVSQHTNEDGQNAVQVTGKVVDVDPELVVRPQQPDTPQTLPVEPSNLKQDSNAVLPVEEQFLMDEPTVEPSVTDQVQNNEDVNLQKDDSDKASPLQPRTERFNDWPVMATSSGAANAAAVGSSGTSGVSGGGAIAPAVALSGTTTGLVTPDYDYAFRMERLDGFSQWSQAPPGRPPQYTSFSQTQWR